MQSGISASQELVAAFQAFIDDSGVCGLLVSINNEELVPGPIIPAGGSFDEDLARLGTLLSDDIPSYIILRRFPQDVASLISIAYVPDIAHVRQKMLFASTRNTLLRELGTEKFAESLFATTKAELSAEAFQKHDHHSLVPAPLTEEETSLKQVRDAEAEASRGTSLRKAHVSGALVFPLSEEALGALKSLSTTHGVNLVQLTINTEKETVELASASSPAIGDFTRVIPNDVPRYSFFIFEHTWEGAQQSPVVFIYTCPPESSVKQRMLYAACRSSVIAVAEEEGGLRVEKRIEAAFPSEVGEEQLLAEFHPKNEVRNSFSRPKRPGRR